MSDVTRILNAIEEGDSRAAEELLPLVYQELRKLAAARMSQESSDHTLQATALVHEAYLRLVGSAEGGDWDNRGHFFAAASEAMRRILVDEARRKMSRKHGGEHGREELPESGFAIPAESGELLAIDEALDKLEDTDEPAAQLVKLRYYTGLTIDEIAQVQGISVRKAHYLWAFARSWLRREIRSD